MRTEATRRLIIACIFGAVFVTGVLLLLRGARQLATPETPDELYQKARQAIEAGELTAARPQIFQLRLMSGQETRVDFLQGMLDLKAGEYRDAVRELGAAARSEELRLDAMALLGEACYRLGQHAEAQQVLTEVLKRDPDRHPSRRWLAASLYDIGAMELAMEQLEILAGQLPADGRALRLRALIQKDFERFAEAADDYRESLKRDPKPPDLEDVLLELAECQVRLFRHEEALSTLRQTTQSAASLVLQAEALQALNRTDEARQKLAAALQENPQHGAALLLQAQLLLNENQAAEAVELLRAAVVAEPHEYQARYQLSNVLRQLGQNEEADRQAAEMQRLQGLRDEFTKLHEKAFQDTQDAELRFRLGELAGELGKPDLARIWFQAALALDPSHAEAADRLQSLPDHSAPPVNSASQ